MANRRTPAQSVEMRSKLLDTAAALFAIKGYQATSVREIAEKHDLLSGSLYYYFQSKEELVNEILQPFLEGLMAEYRNISSQPVDPPTALATVINIAFASFAASPAPNIIWQRDSEFLRTLDGFDYLREAEDELRDIWTNLLRSGQESGHFRRSIDANTAFRIMRDAIMVAVRWFRPRDDSTSEDLARQYIDVFLGGIQA